eukprot:4765626-Karenia_brevis.AAC.1
MDFGERHPCLEQGPEAMVVFSPGRGYRWVLEDHPGRMCGWRWRWKWRWRHRFGLSLTVDFGERYPCWEQGLE